MGDQFKEIPLHRLNIPSETLRQSSTNAGDEILKKSLEQFGVLSPFVVTELGRKGKEREYAVWDGTRRTRLLRELNWPTTRTVPAMVVLGPLAVLQYAWLARRAVARRRSVCAL